MIDNVCNGLQYMLLLLFLTFSALVANPKNIYIPMQNMASVDPNHDTLFVFSSSDDKSSGGYKRHVFYRKIRTRLDLLSIPQSGGFFFQNV